MHSTSLQCGSTHKLWWHNLLFLLFLALGSSWVTPQPGEGGLQTRSREVRLYTCIYFHSSAVWSSLAGRSSWFSADSSPRVKCRTLSYEYPLPSLFICWTKISVSWGMCSPLKLGLPRVETNNLNQHLLSAVFMIHQNNCSWQSCKAGTLFQWKLVGQIHCDVGSGKNMSECVGFLQDIQGAPSRGGWIRMNEPEKNQEDA